MDVEDLNKLGGLLFISFLVVFWWVGIWGILEALVRNAVRSWLVGELLIYSTMVILVIIIVFANPSFITYFA
jgi:hypothetical protein